MSDNVSLSSAGDSSQGAGGGPGGIMVEEVGVLSLVEFAPKRLVLLNYTLAALSEDNRLLLGEIRSRGGDDWTLAARSVTHLGGRPGAEDRRYVDLALVPNVHQGGTSIVFLVEKKNKERFVTAHGVKHGKTLALDEEFTAYDKVNVLGKGVTHIMADLTAAEPTVFSISNLLRKLRLEDGGSTLKPTPARAQVPAEAQDGTLSMVVQPLGAPSKQRQAMVVVAFKTKSASKNKFMIEWYHSKKDELACLKTPVKLGEDCEPTVLLGDPKDARTVYALCKHKSNNTTSLYKVSKGKKQDEPIITLNFEVDIAAMGLSEDGQSVTLLASALGAEAMRIFTLAKTEGFRGRHPVCAHCPALEAIKSPAHTISCATSRWQLTPSMADKCFSHQVALVTLIEGSTGRIAVEPETGNPFRLRVIGCDTQGYSPEAILLEDLERTFENAEDKLAGCTLKLCVNSPPCSDRLSHISGWLIAGRLASVEMNYVKSAAANPQTSGSSSPENSSSDRFSIKAISADKFRSYVTDVDWSQLGQRQGTFTLDTSTDSGVGNMSVSCHSSLSSSGGASGIPQLRGSKIPVSRNPSNVTPPASLIAATSTPARSAENGHYSEDEDEEDENEEEEEDQCDTVKSNGNEVEGVEVSFEEVDAIARSMDVVLRDNANLRDNLAKMQRKVDALKARLAGDN